MESRKPQVGIGVIVIKDHLILLGKRLGRHGHGSWSFPGGHLEFGESWEECAKRETLEEAGITIHNLRFGAVTNDIFDDKHYVTIYIIADYLSGEVRIMEPEKCECWEWYSWTKFPTPLFLPLKNLRASDFNPLKLVKN